MTLTIHETPGSSGIEDVAAILMLLGEDVATTITRHMSEPVIEAIAGTMVRTKTLEAADVFRVTSRLLIDFSRTAAELPGSMDFVRSTLALAFGEDRASELLDKMPQNTPEKFDQLDEIGAATLRAQVGIESTQMQAVLLAHMKRRTAVAYLSSLSTAAASEIIFRHAQIDAVQPAALAEMRVVVSEIARGEAGPRTKSAGGVRQAAELLNAMETAAVDRALATMRAQDEHLAAEVRENVHFRRFWPA